MSRQHDPLAMQLSAADDRVRLSKWLPPQTGVVPRIRIGHRWVNVLWALPLIFLLLVIGVAIAQALRELPAVQNFLLHYPGVPVNAAAVTSGFPAWLRLLHFLNLFFMAFIVRAGIQILADHPRLSWKRDCTPGTEWFRFQSAVPTGRIWTAKDDSVTLPGWLGIPGMRHSIGCARWWHFSITLLWMINGIAFYIRLTFGRMERCRTRKNSTFLVKNDFADYRLRIGGLVDNPAEFSYAALKAVPKQEQMTTHFCIQGWSG